ncbi:NYN domain-containing protein [Haloarcula nitratireducens]|uniref:NYN domain-containing protein n=1 Tax=Haloarcula nitratireducens TaxID=2487749 RepID=A0AAW4PA53_9EURY|nr:NYN domain-containing protein [Halomicroarcula nitratireducens]MBX0294754.1 NYN domain-containing protein [Halomicroarcula nitratireducens]
MNLFRRLRDGESDETERVGLYVDGPNVLRSEFDVDLEDVRTVAESYGPLATTRLYLDENASPGLIQAGEARGFEVITTSGDVDVRLAVDATEAVASGRIDVLVVASRDTDFKPALEVAARNGVRTVALAPGEHGRSDALQNAAQDSLSLDADVE